MTQTPIHAGATLSSRDETALLHQVLKRAAEAVKPKGRATLDEGVYGADLTLRIIGDVQVGAPRMLIAGKVSDGELLAGVLCDMDDAQMMRVVRTAVGRAAKARVGEGEWKDKMDRAKRKARSATDAQAEHLQLTSDKDGAGAVTGKPEVQVTDGVYTIREADAA